MARDTGRRSVSVLGVVVVALLKTLAVLAMIATPLLGVWVASSLAALRRGPVWLTLVAGLLLFPILPVVWELWSAFRRSRRTPAKPRVLSSSDRLILRTLALNAAFLALLLVTQPSAAFTALSARGDWMLDGRHDAQANATRARLFGVAAKLEWLYVAAHDNPFRKYAKKTNETPQPQPRPAPIPTLTPSPQPPATGAADASAKPPTVEPPPPTSLPQAPSWPLPSERDPSILGMPAAAEASISAVADYIKERVPEPLLRLKAVHDYVADRVAYDAEAYLAHVYPPQDAESVFRARKSVCAGYASLLEALGRAAGLEIVFVVGDARTQGSELTGEGHAWNAAKLGDRWYLIDATWDSGTVSGSQFTRRYSTEYFLTPPQIFNIDHFPDEAKWQLLEKPLSRGEFLRQPALSPRFFSSGLQLVAPDRSQVDVQGKLEILLKNPHNFFMAARSEARGSLGQPEDCGVDDGPAPRISCTFSQAGRYDVKLFTNRSPTGLFEFVGQFQVNAN